jgi:N-methylhydantoinase B/oxoprolinase/acetone carboxylase alpha subunit
VNASEHFSEGLRITPIRVWRRGTMLHDVAQLLVSNTRSPYSSMGDLNAQAEATALCEREILRLVERYGKETVVAAMAEVQDYVERIVRHRLAELPTGEWQTVDYLADGRCWGGRSTKDGSGATAPVFGAGLAVQPVEGQERLSPVLTTEHRIVTDSGGPGSHRGGCGLEKGGVLTDCVGTVMSYCCDRARSITWGIVGGLPSVPHGVWLNKGTENERFLGSRFSGVAIGSGDSFTRPSAGGGGMGDPLTRDPAAVVEDVIDGYVSIERAAKDYGVVVAEIDAELDRFDIDEAATRELRVQIAADRMARDRPARHRASVPGR